MKRLIVLSSFLIFFISSDAQQNVKREVITFEYFKMARPDSAKYEAFLHYNIVYHYSFIKKSNNISFDFKINAEFHPDKSFFFAAGKYKDSLLLKHEQGHADIAVLNARKLLSKLNSSSFTPVNYKEKIKAINKEAWRLTMVEQNLYDTETSHGLNKVCQEIWNQKFESAFKK